MLLGCGKSSGVHESDDKVLKVTDITHKLATIMALANASRTSEIHALVHGEGGVGCRI